MNLGDAAEAIGPVITLMAGLIALGRALLDYSRGRPKPTQPPPRICHEDAMAAQRQQLCREHDRLVVIRVHVIDASPPTSSPAQRRQGADG